MKDDNVIFFDFCHVLWYNRFIKELDMVDKIEDVILKHHQRFFNEREYESFISEHVSLKVTPIVFGDDGRNDISYQLYENDKLVF